MRKCSDNYCNGWKSTPPTSALKYNLLLCAVMSFFLFLSLSVISANKLCSSTPSIHLRETFLLNISKTQHHSLPCHHLICGSRMKNPKAVTVIFKLILSHRKCLHHLRLDHLRMEWKWSTKMKNTNRCIIISTSSSLRSSSPQSSSSLVLLPTRRQQEYLLMSSTKNRYSFTCNVP